MKNASRLSHAVVALIASIISVTAFAEDKQSLMAFIPWDGEGQVFRIGPDTMLFLGAFKGVIYARKSSGELDEGFVHCPVTQKIDLQTQATSGSGYCMITVTESATVYAEWTCEGAVGGCMGDFKITAGTGELEGVTGSSRLLVRSPLRALIADMADGSVLRVASGLAILPELQYTVPAK